MAPRHGLFVHSSFLHIAFNMLAVFIFGRMLENLLGTWRFLALYFWPGSVATSPSPC